MEASQGRNPDVVRDIFRVDKRVPLLATVIDLATAMGREPSEFIGASLGRTDTSDWLRVVGEVEAGVFREQAEWSPADWYEVEVGASDHPGEHSGLVVRGRSMDKVLPPGTVLRCVPVIGLGIDIESGDYAIVERKEGALTETTVKRLDRNKAGEWSLVAESTLPEFSSPVFIGKPKDDEEMVFDIGHEGSPELKFGEVRVRALVIDAYLPLRRRKTRPVFV